MPELPEVEAYRRLAEQALRRRITAVAAPDPWYLKRGLDAATLSEVLVGSELVAARRIGKLLLLDTAAPGPTLGLRFGMTGRLIVDGTAGVDQLQHASARRESAWDRFGLAFADGGGAVVRDPRRLGGVELDPDEGRLGPDALTIGPAALDAALGTSRAPLKARLLDQARIAGVGNLIADEALWRAGLAPTRPAGSLSRAERRRLHRHLRQTVTDLLDEGGSHLGRFLEFREAGGRCPKDGAELVRATVGGRTTWWCPQHQR